MKVVWTFKRNQNSQDRLKHVPYVNAVLTDFLDIGILKLVSSSGMMWLLHPICLARR